VDVSENNGTPKSSILIGFSIINHPFWDTPIFRNTHMDIAAASGGATAKRIVHLPRTSPLVRSEALTVYVPVTGKSKKYKKQKA